MSKNTWISLTVVAVLAVFLFAGCGISRAVHPVSLQHGYNPLKVARVCEGVAVVERVDGNNVPSEPMAIECYDMPPGEHQFEVSWSGGQDCIPSGTVPVKATLSAGQEYKFKHVVNPFKKYPCGQPVQFKLVSNGIEVARSHGPEVPTIRKYTIPQVIMQNENGVPTGAAGAKSVSMDEHSGIYYTNHGTPIVDKTGSQLFYNRHTNLFHNKDGVPVVGWDKVLIDPIPRMNLYFDANGHPVATTDGELVYRDEQTQQFKTIDGTIVADIDGNPVTPSTSSNTEDSSSASPQEIPANTVKATLSETAPAAPTAGIAPTADAPAPSSDTDTAPTAQ
ncbi:MAG: hypothetical protein JXX29_14280 [Deltaproteobacteria bacterium]|nr:hypothetical protein [Deltaproteobacteria bacterium]MBN2672846.1 hypothetical protein [Deltaproteobacteria bacterium]